MPLTVTHEFGGKNFSRTGHQSVNVLKVFTFNNF